MILAVILGAILAQAGLAPLSSSPTPWTPPTPTPVVWDGAPASRYSVSLEPLDLSADGSARVLARVHFLDARGVETHLLRGGDFDFFPSRGDAQWQTRLRYAGPAAIIRVLTPGRLDLRVVANKPAELGVVRAHLDGARLRVPPLVARAIGSHLVQVGFYPRVLAGDITIERAEGSRALHPFVRLRPPQSTFRDGSVRPGTTYRYRVRIAARPAGDAQVRVPVESSPGTIDAVRGIGAWIAFSGSAQDEDGYTHIDADRTIDTARKSGLTYLMLRLAYGDFWQITAEAKRTIDRLIDRAAEKRIAMVAWTVPRETSAEDVAVNAAALAYRTPAGHGMSGLAVDLERGEEFLGSGSRGYVALERYLGLVRAAVGPRALLVATVEDPYLGKLDDRTFPYRAIARSADVMQPMTYWRMLRASTTAERMRDAIAGSARSLRAQIGRTLPLIIGGQTVPLSRSGGPPPAELADSIAACRDVGAIGEAFYAVSGTTDAQWDAIGRSRWYDAGIVLPSRKR